MDHALLSCAEMRKAEERSCTVGNHTFFDLMQTAGRAIATEVQEHYAQGNVLVLCGTGNNGGDGYVAAEALRQEGWPVTLVALGDAKTDEAKKAASLWQGDVKSFSLVLLDSTDVVIDALFGTGLSRPLDREAARIVEAVNESDIPVVAADIPSGVHGDSGEVSGAAIKADITVTFGWKKLGHALMPGLEYSGDVILADTGMHEDALAEIKPKAFENHPDLWRDHMPCYKRSGHKYNRGHSLIMGAAEMTGAARLAARAAQRIGAGLVSLGVPSDAWGVYASSCESIMVKRCDSPQFLKNLLNDSRIDSIGIGMGFGTESDRIDYIREILAQNLPSVLDADALTALVADSNHFEEILGPNCVLTPHEGEFKRIFGPFTEKMWGKVAKTAHMARRFRCVVLLKGADTVICGPEGQVCVSSNAPPWLATAGSGDVLAGMISGLLSGGMPPFEAACAAVYYHSEAAHILGPYLIAEDLIEVLPEVLGM